MSYKFQTLFVLLIIWAIQLLAVDASPRPNTERVKVGTPEQLAILEKPVGSPQTEETKEHKSTGEQPEESQEPGDHEEPGNNEEQMPPSQPIHENGPHQSDGMVSGAPESNSQPKQCNRNLPNSGDEAPQSAKPVGSPQTEETKENKPTGEQPGESQEPGDHDEPGNNEEQMPPSRPIHEHGRHQSDGMVSGAPESNSQPKQWDRNLPNSGDEAPQSKSPFLQKRGRPRPPPGSAPQKPCNPSNMFSHFYGYFTWCAEFYKWVERYGKWMSNGVNCMFQ